jgi:glycosyltransferase involved in cell wall biosynthesis
VVRIRSVPLPGYPSFRLGLPGRKVREALAGHGTEIVHLASPVFLGAYGAAAAGRLGLPVVAVYQTDLPSYARAYRLSRAGEAFAWGWLRGVHRGAARTLAPSTVTAASLLAKGIGNVWLWGRGVDTERFHPARRSEELRAALLAGGTGAPAMLAASGYPVAAGPDPEPSSPPPGRLAEFGWLATKGTAWVARRSTDLVPALVALAVRELLGASEPDVDASRSVHA